MNNESSTIVALPYDAFVGLLWFKGEADTNTTYKDDTSQTASTVDKMYFYCMSTGTAPSGGIALSGYGNDWTATNAGALSAKDTTNSDEYTCYDYGATT